MKRPPFKNWDDAKAVWKKVWYFIWEDDSIWSWIANIIVAYVIIRFLFYPFVGLLLSTSHPLVAVVSGSMEHDGSFNDWWSTQQDFYQDLNISSEYFQTFRFKNGFNTGDIMILKGKDPSKIKVGDVIVFGASKPDPIIHRVVQVKESNGKYAFQTKGDHNSRSNRDELNISEDAVIGEAWFRIPYLGWIKIGFVKLISVF